MRAQREWLEGAAHQKALLRQVGSRAGRGRHLSVGLDGWVDGQTARRSIDRPPRRRTVLWGVCGPACVDMPSWRPAAALASSCSSSPSGAAPHELMSGGHGVA